MSDGRNLIPIPRRAPSMTAATRPRNPLHRRIASIQASTEFTARRLGKLLKRLDTTDDVGSSLGEVTKAIGSLGERVSVLERYWGCLLHYAVLGPGNQFSSGSLGSIFKGAFPNVAALRKCKSGEEVRAKLRETWRTKHPSITELPAEAFEPLLQAVQRPSQ